MGRANVLCGVLFSVLVSNVLADELKTVYDLDVLQSQTTYYKAVAARDKALEEVKNPTSSSDSQTHAQTPPQAFQQGGNTASTPSQGVSLPVVSKIIGGGNKIAATLSFSDGSMSIKRSGEMLPGGYQITGISINGVTVKNISTGKTQVLSEGGR
ncbi:type IV pilus biogenesis protein PilP [Buttiauxella sp. B2]|uniref:type IV pilus biogenesis protein PilP n=1 Tax=Buttiauxella sp. B2 TaxID=2587812 RepID=UPI001121392F|nr:type IV pilus biogenesis protein PilP [Buttiauxella sp. B2]TNV16096.1 type IV pilus biogenesis protein PilP [Buttiauxella sp. B2]